MLVFRYTVLRDEPTPGSALLNLRYRNELFVRKQPAHAAFSDAAFRLSTAQKACYGAAFVALPWVWARWRAYMLANDWSSQPSSSWRYRVWGLTEQAEIAYRIVALVNFWLFLFHGRFRSVLERLLSMRLIYIQSRVARQVSFEFMNQQLVWHGFSEFLLFVIPLIDFGAIVRGMKRVLAIQAPEHHGHGDAGDSRRDMSSMDPAAVESAAKARHSAAQCPICDNNPIIMPHITPCGHVYCYTCLRSHCMADPSFACRHCNRVVTSHRPL
eukprot:TRINITY_DN67324_c11_g7_i1.p1 TRINITY_DN67324_c11_g7~~TRINITY_DN67324_c11_g7_i1.p1  ORF type:complete len:270 (+),score=85.75 TRINITY_DN67324_c11_g7_i1:3-812(+)